MDVSYVGFCCKQSAAGPLSKARQCGHCKTPELGNLQQGVLSHFCCWQWEVLHRKDTGAGYCLWSIACPQCGGSHPRSHIPAFICLIQCLHLFAIPDLLCAHPSPARTNEPQALPPSLAGCRLVCRRFLVPSRQAEAAVCVLAAGCVTPAAPMGTEALVFPARLPHDLPAPASDPPTLLGHHNPAWRHGKGGDPSAGGCFCSAPLDNCLTEVCLRPCAQDQCRNELAVGKGYFKNHFQALPERREKLFFCYIFRCLSVLW